RRARRLPRFVRRGRGRPPARPAGRCGARQGLARRAHGGGRRRPPRRLSPGRGASEGWGIGVLYHLFYFFRHDVTGFNVVRYITFRTAVASLTALFLVLILGPWMIERLRRLQVGQYIREEGPQAHQTKAGTPTMGGLLILTGVIVHTLLWVELLNSNVWITLGITLC